MLLEQRAAHEAQGEADPPILARSAEGLVEIDTRPLIQAAVRDLRRGDGPSATAAAFHASFARAVADAAVQAASEAGLDRVVLGGGVFANDRFTSTLVARLTDAGLRAYLPWAVPVGDGGIALGQVLVANARREVA